MMTELIGHRSALTLNLANTYKVLDHQTKYFKSCLVILIFLINKIYIYFI